MRRLNINIGCEVDLAGLKPYWSLRMFGSTNNCNFERRTEAYNLYMVCVSEIGRNDEESRGSLVEGFGSIATLECVQIDGTWQELKQ